MKKDKKWMAVGLALTIVLVVAGCGDVNNVTGRVIPSGTISQKATNADSSATSGNTSNISSNALTQSEIGKVRTVGFAFWRDAYSAWEVGSLPNKSHTEWNAVFVYTGMSSNGHQVQLYQLPKGQNMPTTGKPTVDVFANGIEAYDGMWICPKPIGLIKITGASGHIIRFKSNSGITGTFNFVTHKWVVQ